MKKTLLTPLLLLALTCFSYGKGKENKDLIEIPLNGNVYVTSGKGFIRNGNIKGWNSEETVFSNYFKVSNPGKLNLYLEGKSFEGKSTIEVSSLGKKFKVTLEPQSKKILVGTIDVKSAQYIKTDIKGLKKSGEEFGEITGFFIEGNAAKEPLHFVRDFEPYWGMRGPSVHMGYAFPNENIEYFYNEVTVTEGNDVQASYYMANGFGEGYFGIQVNSPTERRILFSVWSPFDTQNPNDIPDDQKIRNTAKGEGVHIGEFGNEGSGGQSYLIYPWKADTTYRFLTRVHPDGNGNTEYSAWFYAPEEKNWRLIATFIRPKTDTWYRGAHSFLENFDPRQGYITREVQIGRAHV